MSHKEERLYVFILTALQFVHIMDFVIMMPLGPTFMKEFSIGPKEFSWLVSSYTFSAAICGLIVGPIADHFERKKFMNILFIGFLLGTFLCAMANSFSTMILGRIIAGAFGGVVSASVLAILAELIPIQRRGQAMGVVMSSFSIASVLGVPTGLYIANIFDWNSAFFLILILGIVFLFLSFIYLPIIPVHKTNLSFAHARHKFKTIFLNADYVLGLIVVMLMSLASFSMIPFIAPFTVSNVGLSEMDLPLIYLVGGAFTIFSSRAIGKLSDHFGNYQLLLTVGLLSFIPIIWLTHLSASSLTKTLFVTTLFMMFVSGRFVPVMTMVSNIVSNKDRGAFMNFLNAIRQFGSGIATIIGGMIITEQDGKIYDYHRVGYFAVAICLIAFTFALKLKKKDEQAKL